MAHRSNAWKGFKLSFVIAASMLIAAACGGDDDKNSAAETSTSASDSAGSTSLGQKTVGVLVNVGASDVQARWVKTVEAALSAIGWKADSVDGKGDPQIWQQAVAGFVNKKVDAMIIMVVDAPAIQEQLEAAKAAGIPVIATGITVNPQGKELYAANYAPDDFEIGRNLARYMVDKFPKGTEVVTQRIRQVYGADALLVGALPILKDAGFEIAAEQDIDLLNIVESFRQGTIDLVTAHPNAKILMTCCDLSPPINVGALLSKNKTGVTVSSRYDNDSNLAAIRDGKVPVVVSATNSDQGPLIAVDQLLKHFAKGATIDPDAAKGVFEYKVIDKSNAPATGRVYDSDKQVADFVARWKTEYKLP